VNIQLVPYCSGCHPHGGLKETLIDLALVRDFFICAYEKKRRRKIKENKGKI
jgi:hypothetical protein